MYTEDNDSSKLTRFLHCYAGKFVRALKSTFLGELIQRAKYKPAKLVCRFLISTIYFLKRDWMNNQLELRYRWHFLREIC